MNLISSNHNGKVYKTSTAGFSPYKVFRQLIKHLEASGYEIDVMSIKSAIEEAKYGIEHCADTDETEPVFKEIVYHLSDVEWELNRLRESNDKLRSWGYELEDKIAELEKEISSLNI